MRIWRLLVIVLVALTLIWSALWVIGFGLVRTQITALVAEPTSLVDAPQVDDLLAEELADSTRNETESAAGTRSGGGTGTDSVISAALPGLRITDFGLAGFPFGYAIRLTGAALDHPDLRWRASDDVILSWQVFRPFSVRLDFSGSHKLSLPAQSPLTLSLDGGELRVAIQPLWNQRTGRLARVQTQAEAVLIRVNDHDVVNAGRFEFSLNAPEQLAPATVSADVFDLASSDHPRVQGLYRQLLATFPRADATLNALGLGLDQPVDHIRLRATIDPVFPLFGASYRHRFFVARGGNVLVEVLDVKQGQWQGRVSARAMFGPDGRLMIQACPQLQAGVSYVPLPSMILPSTLYIGEGRFDVSPDPIPAIALPDNVAAFTQTELCSIGRGFVLDAKSGG